MDCPQIILDVQRYASNVEEETCARIHAQEYFKISKKYIQCI